MARVSSIQLWSLTDISPITLGGNRQASIPKIIYASRTHSQLAQVIQELKNTRYRYSQVVVSHGCPLPVCFCLRSRPRVAIIGSREQLCIHPEVAKKETNSEKVCFRECNSLLVVVSDGVMCSSCAQVHLCRAKVQSHSCIYFNNTDGVFSFSTSLSS